MSSIAVFLLLVSVKVAAALGIVAVVDLLLLRRYASAATRHLVWSIAVVVSLAMPLLAALLPPLRAPILGQPSLATSFEATSAPAAPAIKAMSAMNTVVAPTPSTPPPPALRIPPAGEMHRAPGRSISAATALLVAYVAGVLFILARIMLDHAAVWRITRRAHVEHDSVWTNALRAVARRSGLRRRVTMLRSDSAVMPLTVGILRPRIVVPDVAATWPDEMREAVVMHEMAHIERGDCLTQSLAALACALYWPNPLAWWAAARLRVERELACDDIVIGRGVRAHDYASHLLNVARALRAPRLAVSMAAATGLEQRLRAVIDDSRRRGAPRRRSAVLTTVSAFGLAATLAAVRPVSVDARTPSLTPVFVGGAIVRPVAAAPDGRFTVRLATPDDGPANAGRIHFMMETPGLNTFYTELATLDGFNREQLAIPGTPLRFKLRRDAGTFDFTGDVYNRYGRGTFTFTPDPAYVDALARRGIQPISAEQQFSLARHDVSLAYVEELARQGYAMPTPYQLNRAGMSSVDLEFIRDMGALGYRLGTLDALVSLSNQSVDPAFIRDANARAGRMLTARELLAVRNGRVLVTQPAAPVTPPPPRTPAVQPVEAAEPTDVADDTVVTGKWSIVPRANGVLQLDIEWANVNQWKRFIRPADLVGVTLDEMQRGEPRAAFRIEQEAGTFAFDGAFTAGRGSGLFTFQPNKSFAATLRSAGVRETDRVKIHQLKNLAFGFVTAANAREIVAAGPEPLTLEQLIDLTIFSVPPSYPGELRALGVQGVESYHQLIDLYRRGVTPEFIRQVRGAGQRDLTADALIELRRRR
ncbi:MAG TPA: M56 family metallopeptidase [Gemmatimonadaceae bacterium]|nr:M56 family metallopeptidase [Gemmatimonadaceae bacterium]